MCEAHIDLSELMTEYERLAAANAAGAVELQDVPGVVEAVRRIVARHYHPNAQTLIAMETADLLAAIGAALKGEAGNA
jgi:hypothetical protein